MEQEKFYQTEEFKSLQTKWYSKLKKKGFNDIEFDYDLDGPVRDPSDRVGERALNIGDELCKEEYYRRACQFYWDFSWKKEFGIKSFYRKKMWWMHMSGSTYREIGKRYNMDHTVVWRTVEKIRKHFMLYVEEVNA